MYVHMCAYIQVCAGQYVYVYLCVCVPAPACPILCVCVCVCALSVCMCVCVRVCYLLMTSSTVVFLTDDVWPSASVIGV
jgi:hypothetical protein